MRDKRISIRTLLINISIFLGVIIGFSISYETNDDTSIQNTLSGVMAGRPLGVHEYINVILSSLVSFLYRVMPQIQWWFWLQMVLIFTGSYLILLYVNAFLQVKFGMVIIFIIDVLIYFSLIAYFVINISFTITPMIFFCGIFLRLFLPECKSTITIKDFALIGITILTVWVVYLFRDASGYVATVLETMGMFYFLRKKKCNLSKSIMGTITVFAICTVMIIVSSVVDNKVKNNVQSTYYNEFNEQRIKYMDYGHVDFSEAEEMFLSYNWDRNLYELVDLWFFMDPRVNAESLEQINTFQANETVKHFKSYLYSIVNKICHDQYWLFCAFFLLCVGGIGEFCFFKMKKWKTVENLIFIGCIAMGWGMFFYQCFIGRMVFRSFMVFAIPIGLLEILLICKVAARNSVICKNKTGIFLVICFVILLSVSIVNLAQHKTIITKNDTLKLNRLVNNYAIENPNAFLITDLTLSSMIDIKLYNTKPSNVLLWGGSSYYSFAYYEKLKKYGFDEFFAKELLNENAYYLTLYTENLHDDNKCFRLLTEYMEDLYDAFPKIQILDDKVAVIKFVEESADFCN